MKLIPLQDRLIVRSLNKPDKTAGGILLPESVNPRGPVACEVLAAGPGLALPNGAVQPMEVKVGDHVLVSEYMPGVEVLIDGEKCRLISEADVLAWIQ